MSFLASTNLACMCDHKGCCDQTTANLKIEVAHLLATLATERDQFGKKETEMKADLEDLRDELKAYKAAYEGLKQKLESENKTLTIEKEGYRKLAHALELEVEGLRAENMRLREALKNIQQSLRLSWFTKESAIKLARVALAVNGEAGK